MDILIGLNVIFTDNWLLLAMSLLGVAVVVVAVAFAVDVAPTHLCLCELLCMRIYAWFTDLV